LDALSTAIKIRKVNWILDADIRNFFGAVSQDWIPSVDVQTTSSGARRQAWAASPRLQLERGMVDAKALVQLVARFVQKIICSAGGRANEMRGERGFGGVAIVVVEKHGLTRD
jgi:hypothetical protein